MLFQSCVASLKGNNRERAAICANELAEVRKLISFLKQVELAIERVILRLETIKELSIIVGDLRPALHTLQEVSKQLFSVLPEVSSELNEINNVISETIYATKISEEKLIIPVGNPTPDGVQILEEVSGFLENELKDKLPEPPADKSVVVETEAKGPIKQMVALAASCSQASGAETLDEFDKYTRNLFSVKKSEIQEVSLKVRKLSLEDALLEYVRHSGGEIDLTQCSRELDVSYDEVEKALQNLGAKGKIKIEARG
ncbi:MAG: hypothetical protein RMK50_01370 [Nitrososphaerota archaeon]|nr:hypothetical protein [Candidatus Bathyarchaeota archaeon]MDW8193465.1 hypothetical protein [Nitrososphaerota archaeon]